MDLRTEERLAVLITWIVRTGMILLLICFGLYASGAIAARPTPGEVTQAWELSAAEYAQETGRPSGWAWLFDLRDGGSLAFAGVVFFPTAAIIALIGAAILFARERSIAYLLLCLAEAAVLTLAASGVFLIR